MGTTGTTGVAVDFSIEGLPTGVWIGLSDDSAFEDTTFTGTLADSEVRRGGRTELLGLAVGRGSVVFEVSSTRGAVLDALSIGVGLAGEDADDWGDFDGDNTTESDCDDEVSLGFEAGEGVDSDGTEDSEFGGGLAIGFDDGTTGSKLGDGVSVGFDNVTCTPDDVAADESKGA